MAETLTTYRTFIASPGDVAAERQLAEEAIARINLSIRDTIGAHIDVRKWEHSAPVVSDGSIQERLLEDEVANAHFFILILFKRYGTRMEGQEKSNTEREIDAILRRRELHKKVKIFSYFRELPDNLDPGDQEVAVRALRQRLEKLDVPFRLYRDPLEFKEALTHDLYDQVMRLQVSSFRQIAMRKFWRFGEAENRTRTPRLAIVYPTAERAWFKEGDDEDYWRRRLTTQIAFEDHKAIEKITRTLLSIRFTDYRVYPSTSLPAEIEHMNGLWLCLPRNQPGLARIVQHPNARFSFEPSAKGERPTSVQWRTFNGDSVVVRSPLGIYLSKQRSLMNTRGEWHRGLARLVAKDFAVLARLSRQDSGYENDEPFKDYFLGGIRGLGTWGAAWMLENQASAFRDIDPEADLQRLLEVVYRDGRIFQVSDVSEKPASYFEEQRDSTVIDSIIAEALLG